MKNKIIIAVLVVLFVMIFSVGVGSAAQTHNEIETRIDTPVLIGAEDGEAPPNEPPPTGTGVNPRGTQRRPRAVPAPNINQGNNRNPQTIWTTHPWERVIINPDIHIPGDERLIPDTGAPRVLRPNRGAITDILYRGGVPRRRTLIPGMPRDTIGGELVFRGASTFGRDMNPNLPWDEVEFPILPEPTQVEPTITRQTNSLVRRRNFQVLSYDWTFTISKNHTTRGGLPPRNRVSYNEAYITFPTTGRWIVTIHPWNSWELHQYERIVTTTTVPAPRPPSPPRPPGSPPPIPVPRTYITRTSVSYEHRGLLRTVEGRHTSQPMQTFRILVIRPNETIRVPSPNQQFFESDFELIR